MPNLRLLFRTEDGVKKRGKRLRTPARPINGNVGDAVADADEHEAADFPDSKYASDLTTSPAEEPSPSSAVRMKSRLRRWRRVPAAGRIAGEVPQPTVV